MQPTIQKWIQVWRCRSFRAGRYCIAVRRSSWTRAVFSCFARSSSGIGIDQLLLIDGMTREQVDEGPHLRREMMAVRIDGIHGKFDWPVFGQQPDQLARFKIVPDQESRRKPDADTGQRRSQQGF